jgi:hypothetical protein
MQYDGGMMVTEKEIRKFLQLVATAQVQFLMLHAVSHALTLLGHSAWKVYHAEYICF